MMSDEGRDDRPNILDLPWPQYMFVVVLTVMSVLFLLNVAIDIGNYLARCNA